VPIVFFCIAALLQEASAAADAARQEAGSARAALSASQSHAQALQARLASKAAELSGLSGREEALKERVNDLQAFVDVSRWMMRPVSQAGHAPGVQQRV
jgi:chromosome segregation ATPase